MSTLQLASFPIFQPLPEDDLAMIERIMVVEKHRAGHVFVREGQRGSAVTSNLYLLLEGEVTLSHRIPGRGDVALRQMQPGQLFGLISFLDQGLRSATCTARTHVRTAKLSRTVFDVFFKQHRGVHARFQMAIAQQLASDFRQLMTLLTNAEGGDLVPLEQRFRAGG